jgi:hypothetical protein
LDPENQKTVVELQEEAAKKRQTEAATRSSKKRKRSDETDDSESEDDSTVEETLSDTHMDSVVHSEVKPQPMTPSGSIADLRSRLHEKIASFRRSRGVSDDEPSSKDQLLEARRLKRAELRENRRKETKEKKRLEREKKKGKKERESGNTSKVGIL